MCPHPHGSRALIALALASSCVPLSCAPAAIDEPLAYPAPDVAASCVTSPTLCGLALHDLGGGDHPNAFHIVLLGDGYLDDEQETFAWHANSLASSILRPDGVFTSTDLVVRAPELFHFWRVDVPSDSIEVDDRVLTNTPLGAHLGAPDHCTGKPLIRAIEDRFALALDNATLASPEDDDLAARRRYGWQDQGDGDLRADEVSAWPEAPVTSARATFVLLSHRSIGRANATPGGHVRLSSFDGADTMAHELGHALFHLGDEYTEFSTCAPSPLPITCGPPPDIGEVGLLESANTSTLHDGSKWSNDVDGSMPGGNRWPCHDHPTSACLMLGGNGPLCPVCASAVEERFARRRCLDDTRPPRVAIEKDPAIFAGGTRVLVAASAFDERALGSDSIELAWTLDGAPIAGASGPFAVLDLASIAGREVRATASDGRFTHASSPVALPFTVTGDDDDGDEDGDVDGDDDDADAAALRLGPLRVASTVASIVDGAGTLEQIVRGVGARVAIGVQPLACTRVVRAGITVRVNGGPLKTKDLSLVEPVRVGCDGSPSALYLTYEPGLDAGDALEVHGFVVDAKGRTAETEAWRPVVVDRTTCDLGVHAAQADGSALGGSPTSAGVGAGAGAGAGDGVVLGAFDPIVVDAPASAVELDVRVGHLRADTLPRGALGSAGVVIMPVGLPTSTGDAIDVDVLGLCSVPVGDGVHEAVWATATTRVQVRWDNEPPAIAAQTSLAPWADAWHLAVVDDSAIAGVTIAAKPVVEGGPPPAPLSLTAPPWVVSPPPLGELVITATDVAGNKSTRVVAVTQQTALDGDVVCPVGDAR